MSIIDSNELDTLRADRAALRTALQSAIKIASEAADEWDKAPAGMKAGKLLLALCGHLKGYRADIDAVHATLAESMKLLVEEIDSLARLLAGYTQTNWDALNDEEIKERAREKARRIIAIRAC